jgi:selenocysteine-specific elongation factor
MEEFKKLEGSLEDRVEGILGRSGFWPKQAAELARRLGYEEKVIRAALDGLLETGRIKKLGTEKVEAYLHARDYVRLGEKLISIVQKHAESHAFRALMPVAEFRAQSQKITDALAAEAILGDLLSQKALVQKDAGIGLAGHEAKLSQKDQELVDRVERAFKKAGFASPLEEDIRRECSLNLKPFREIMKTLIDEKKLVRLDAKVTYHGEALEAAREMVLAHLRRHKSITIAELRTKLGLSRKYAHAILEYFDKIGLTRRVEDRHVLK